MYRRLIAIITLVLLLCQQAGWAVAVPMAVDPDVPAVEDCHDRESHHQSDDDPATGPLDNEQASIEQTAHDCCEIQCECSMSAQFGAIAPTHIGATPPASTLLPAYLSAAPSVPFQRLLRPPITA